MKTYRVKLREVECRWPLMRHVAECPICGMDYEEVTREHAGSHAVEAETEVVAETPGCRHLVDLDGDRAVFARWPLLFARWESRKARLMRSGPVLALRRLRRKMLW